MNSDLIRGHSIRFTFNDGPMAQKTFEHTFDREGTVRFRAVGAGAAGRTGQGDESKQAPDPRYEVAMVGDDVAAVSYLGSGGYTLTTVLDFRSKTLVAFSSNEKAVSVQHGTFAYSEAAAPARTPTAQEHGSLVHGGESRRSSRPE